MPNHEDLAKKPKIKIVAVAKDEAAYFPEWIHHHLFFGFDAIEIHINRTTDNSAEVLSSICSEHPSVSWQVADWVDLCPGDAKNHIQFIIYAKALAEMRLSGEFTHVFFLDIDEFWCPTDFSIKIQDYLLSLASDKAIFFEWINDLGNLLPFSSIPQNIEGNLSPLGKTLLPIDLELVELRHHVPLIRNKSQHILANGEVFEGREKMVQALNPTLNSLKNAFVYHRAHRSEMEYVSLVYRGRPGNSFKYKNNRKGIPRRSPATLDVYLSDFVYKAYSESLEGFMDSLNIELSIANAQSFVRERYEHSVNNMDNGLHAGYKYMLDIFHGVKIPEITAKFQQYRKRMISKQPFNANLIRDFAINAASQDIDEAIELMKKAQHLRPKGPQIRKYLENFEKNKLKRLKSAD
jgi:hypothetical protein